MATRRWLGTAQNIAQVDTITAANTWATNDTASITIGAVTITVTIGTAVATTDVVAAVAAAVNGDAVVGDETRNTTGNLHPEFSWITATTSGSTCILTGDTAGRPFTASEDSSTAGDGTWVLANTTTATGRNWWTNTANWSGGSLPADGDTIVFDKGSVSCLYGLDISATAHGTSLCYIDRTYSGDIGLSATNSDTVGATYSEYNDQYLKTSMGGFIIGQGSGSGSGLIRIDHDGDACDISVHYTGTSTETGKPACIFANNDGGTVEVFGGDVGIDTLVGQASPDVTIKIGSESGTSGTPTVSAGPGAVITNCYIWGGTHTFRAASIAAMEHYGGTTLIACTPVTTMTIEGGTVSISTDATNSTINGTTWTIGGTGTLNTTRAVAGVTTVNPIDMYGTGCSLIDPTRNISSLVVDQWYSAELSQIDRGGHNRLTFGTPA